MRTPLPVSVAAILLVPLFVLVLPAAARAQERGQVGLTMGYPSSVGFIWHTSDKLAVRPEISLAHSSSETEANAPLFVPPSGSDTWAVSGGVSALWYLDTRDRVRTYFSPRITFGHTSTDYNLSDVGPVSGNAIGGSGSFGAQYSPVRKFGVFGEVGYGFSRSTSKYAGTITRSKVTNWNWATRTAVGVIFYFGRS